MATRVRINTPKIERRLKTRIGQALKIAQVDKIILADLILELRSGKGPRGSKLKPLKSSTITNRRKLSKKNPTHPDYSPTKSNLTFTGELLNKGLKSNFNVAKLAVIIFASKAKHKLYKGLSKRKGEGPRKRESYDEIFKRQSAMGRDAFGFGNQFLLDVKKKIILEAKKALKQIR